MVNNNFFYPVSAMQGGMIYHSVLAPSSGVNIQQIVFSLQEQIDVEKFHKAWIHLSERHTILRTAFVWEGLENPHQEVFAKVEIPFVVHSMEEESEESSQKIIQDFIDKDRKTDFDLTKAPLSRLNLFKLAKDSWEIIWTFHHLILDGRSFCLVLKELFDIYEALLNQEVHPVLPKTKPYKIYIDWISTQDFEKTGEFWRKYLSGIKTPNPLPLRNASQGNHIEGDIQVLEKVLSKELTGKLRDLAKMSSVSLNNVLQGAWALLLYHYSGEKDIVFGTTRACRYSSLEEVKDMIGIFINTLPLRISIEEHSIKEWLKTIKKSNSEIREFEQTPLLTIQSFSEVPSGESLFDSLIIFDHQKLDTSLKSHGKAWENRNFSYRGQTNYPLALYGYGDSSMLLELEYDSGRYPGEVIIRIMENLATLLEGMVENPESSPLSIPYLSENELDTLIRKWNNTTHSYPADRCMHQLFEEKANEQPDSPALYFRGQELSYAQLNSKSNQVAAYLRESGVRSGDFVGVLLNRSPGMLISLLGILKSGAAYVPLDPNYPGKRIAFMAEDSGAKAVITKKKYQTILPDFKGTIVVLDEEKEKILQMPEENLTGTCQPEDLAYVIYTSGSTGKPKGVMVEHRNAINFFVGMDQKISQEGRTWLAVTSISFDISVLELFWTLARGFKIVLFSGHESPESGKGSNTRHPEKKMQFSLFYWNVATEENQKDSEKYRLVMEGAKFGDQNGFSAIWTPERHFHSFGGIFPNPSVISAAIAATTKRINIRSGSIVVPLHNPIRIAEEWSVVDNLSQGRVGLSIAPGWAPTDFAIMPENFADAKSVMLKSTETVKKLWRGEKITVPGPKGPVTLQSLPRPIQKELPIWQTTAGNPESFAAAGRSGYNVLTHLLGQTIEVVAEKLKSYRKAWKEAGHPGEGHVTLMLHTLVGKDLEAVKKKARAPMKEYLKSAMFLVKEAAWQFPAFKKMSEKSGKSIEEFFETITPEELDALLEFAFERYYSTSGLFGTPSSCVAIVDRLKEIGVDEIGCLIDFGLETETVIEHFPHLNELRENANASSAVQEKDENESLSALIRSQKVTHFQCTPSMARMMTQEEDSREALASLNHMMVGGEAFPPELAKDLHSLLKGGRLTNMYGPTETTIWSTTFDINDQRDPVPIGRPIANTQIYLLDPALKPVPMGVPGEIWIGGDGVVRGYLGQPKLTEERFLKDPFQSGDTSRMYRTGDLARYLEDGTLEFISRIDYQVKLRGHRIELGEIEAFIREIQTVREAIVLVREDIPGNQRLVAYYRTEDEKEISLEQLKAHLQERLPEFMVPAHYMLMEKFPLTPNGKIDRKAFPAPDDSQAVVRADYTPPENEMEEIIAEIWKQALGIQKIGREDRFFDIGGHSLLAMQVLGQLRKKGFENLQITDIFRFPTIRSLAKHLNQAQGKTSDSTSQVQDRASRRAAMRKRKRSSR